MNLDETKRKLKPDWLLIGRIALFSVPLLLGVLWIDVISAEAYRLWFVVQRVADTGLSAENGLSESVALLFALPLFISRLAGIPLSLTAPLLSALGWSFAALLFLELLRKRVHLFVAGLTALLLVLSPAVTLISGTAVGWTIASLLLGVLTTMQARWRWQLVAIIGVLGTSFSLAGGVAVVIMLLVHWRNAERRQAVWGIVVAVAYSLVWIGLVFFQFGALSFSPLSNVQNWLALLNELLNTTALFWLYVPFIVVGIIVIGREARSFKLAGAVAIVFLAAVLSEPLLALALTAVIVLTLTALGIGFVQERVSAESHPVSRSILLPLILITPLLFSNLIVLRRQKIFTPQRYMELEEQAAAWLKESTATNANLFASARIGYLADRHVAVDSATVSESDAVPSLLPDLLAYPPDYIVTDRSIGWDLLVHQGWFQSTYDLIAEFVDSAEPTAPIAIWQHTGAETPVHPLVTDMPVGANLVGYTVSTPEIAPGDGVRLNLLWEAVAPEIDAFHTIVRIVSPVNGTPYAQRDLITPRSVPGAWWQPDMTIREQFVLTTTADVPVGAYAINLSIREPRSNELLRMTANNDSNPIDHFVLGYIAVPPVVTETGAQQVGARFGDEISLLSATVDGAFEPGNRLNVVLFWEALRLPDADYTVFVQLLDAEGNLVASGDGRPMNGAYTTLAWQPGTVIPDTHFVQLPAELGAGEYLLQVGLYRADTGARLAAFSAENDSLPNDAVILKQFMPATNP